MDNNVNFEEFFADRLRERGFDLKKISEVSGIALKHIEALASGNFKNMPPEPYFRGYLIRLGRILNFDHDIWWNKLKSGGFIKTSGHADAMPKNRFVGRPSTKILLASVAAFIFIIYLAVQLPNILGKPRVALTAPPSNPYTTSIQEITLSGTARGASEVRINGETITLGPDGSWSKTVLLQSGLNSFEINAKKFLGGEDSIMQQIIYQPAGSAQ